MCYCQSIAIQNIKIYLVESIICIGSNVDGVVGYVSEFGQRTAKEKHLKSYIMQSIRVHLQTSLCILDHFWSLARQVNIRTHTHTHTYMCYFLGRLWIGWCECCRGRPKPNVHHKYIHTHTLSNLIWDSQMNEYFDLDMICLCVPRLSDRMEKTIMSKTCFESETHTHTQTKQRQPHQQ